MSVLTPKQQKLLITLLDKPLTSKTQSVFKTKESFYKTIWKLRDMELVRAKTIRLSSKEIKEWHLTVDGFIFAKILKKGEKVGNNNGKAEGKE
jgi:hypothetical protein